MAAGDERALGELYDRYGGMAFSLACAIVGEHADAEEVVADAFAQIWRSAAGFDPARGSVAAWVATIARTRALDLVRARRRRARVLEQAAVVTDEGEALVLAPSLDPTMNARSAPQARSNSSRRSAWRKTKSPGSTHSPSRHSYSSRV